MREARELIIVGRSKVSIFTEDCNGFLFCCIRMAILFRKGIAGGNVAENKG